MSPGVPGADVIVVGAGPNGLTAAVAAAREGLSVAVAEGAATIGGGARTAPLTLPGFLHDVCAAVFPLGPASPVFRSLPLERHGLSWIHPATPLAHPFDDGSAAVVERDPGETARALGADGDAYRGLMEPLLADWTGLLEEILAPPHWPRRRRLMARFAAGALLPASRLAAGRFRGFRARALFAGLSAHSFLPLSRPGSAAFGLVLGLLAHAAGWPFARGGSGAVSGALSSCLLSLGGTVATGTPVVSVADLPPSRLVLLDVTPRQLLALAGHRLGAGYAARLRRYRYGPGAFKIDWALAGPVPWTAPECRRAGTVHLGGSMEEIAGAERDAWRGFPPRSPFVLFAQPSLFDASRAPAGRHTGWAYCHVPNGSAADMTARIEAQVERFAPGFRDLILARHVIAAADYERHNPNCIGGDIGGGIQGLSRMLGPGALAYATGVKGLFVCSSSTPPGGGVHGMCGYHAVRAALEERGRGIGR